MSVSKGKRFESNFKDSIDCYNDKNKHDKISYLRLYDPGHGFGGVSNPCDYVLYKYPSVFYLELKERKGDRINFSDCITDGQYEELVKQDKIKGCHGGVLFKFSDHDLCYYVPINKISRHAEEVTRGKNKGKLRWSYTLNGSKSMTPEMAEEEGIILVGEKKRVNWTYDVMSLLRKIHFSEVYHERRISNENEDNQE